MVLQIEWSVDICFVINSNINSFLNVNHVKIPSFYDYDLFLATGKAIIKKKSFIVPFENRTIFLFATPPKRCTFIG